jgi:hypothetical protein
MFTQKWRSCNGRNPGTEYHVTPFLGFFGYGWQTGNQIGQVYFPTGGSSIIIHQAEMLDHIGLVTPVYYDPNHHSNDVTT